jgi:hypothetical protein
MTLEDDELTAAAKALHREWESPHLWPSIAAEIGADERTWSRASWTHSWRSIAAAAVVILSVAASLFLLGDRLFQADRTVPQTTTGGDRLLSDEALSEIERAEARYIAAIEGLAARAARASATPSSPLLVNLRERLLVIDAAIADCRAEIERNRFNTHLRRQLLSIYQEKRRTLEQILEQESHAS